MACTSDATGAGFFVNRGEQDVVGGASFYGESTGEPPAPTASVPSPPAATVPYVIPGGSGYAVTCADGSISMSGGKQGACSHHGGELR
jgi:hypothetical protein